MLTDNHRIWLARFLIGAVTFMNVQSALTFLYRPEAYVAGFELSGAVGVATLRGIAILFLMWNVPYVVATVNPIKYRVSHYEAVAMQTIGLVGESILLLNLDTNHIALQTTVTRFVIFDALGLGALLLAVFITRKVRKD